jgi:penicillin G amidase
MGARILVENLMAVTITDENSPWADDQSTPEKETWPDIVVRSFKETVEELEDLEGTDIMQWNWGNIHTLTLSHPLGVVPVLDKAFKLNRGPFGVPGSYHTACPYSYSYNNLYKVNHGASHRHIYDLNNWDASKTIIPTGTSGIPASDFYLDQMDMYLNHKYHSDPFSAKHVQKSARFQMKLEPPFHE